MARFILFPMLGAMLFTTKEAFVKTTEATGGALTIKGTQQLCEAINVTKRVAAWTAETGAKITQEVDELHRHLMRVQVALENGTWDGTSLQCLNAQDEIVKGKLFAKQAKTRLSELRKKGSLAAIAAGISAGRLEEFLAVFLRTSATSTNFCAAAANDGNPLKGDELTHCVDQQGAAAVPKETEFRHPPENLPKPPALKAEFDTEIKRILGGGDTTAFIVDGKNCKLTGGASSYGALGSGTLAQQVLWGGGVFRVGTTGPGDSSATTLTRADADTVAASSWTKEPLTGVEHLKRASTAIGDYENKLESLERDLKTIKERLLACLPESTEKPANAVDTAFEAHHQNLLEAKANLTAELEKVKGKGTQNPDSKKNPGTPADKATAQETITVSVANLNRLILPWTLLI